MHLTTMPPRDQARVLVDYAWELYVAQRWDDAVARAHQALQTWTEVGDDAAAEAGHGRALALAVHGRPAR